MAPCTCLLSRQSADLFGHPRTRWISVSGLASLGSNSAWFISPMVWKYTEAIMKVCFRHPAKRPPSPCPLSKGHLSPAQGFDRFSVFKCSLLPGGELSDSASIDIMSPLNPYVNRMSNTFTTRAKQVSSWSWQDKYFGPAPAGAMPVCMWAFCLAQTGPWLKLRLGGNFWLPWILKSLNDITQKENAISSSWGPFFFQPCRKFLNIYPEKRRQLLFYSNCCVRNLTSTSPLSTR